ncbi:YcaO-like family protein [Nonomuraea sp. NPDC050680]|uniref:YcaO-like family protein n=1 Tax=Nonomuraea sp. NPDC050680 TaxID=3154630 RepID=UPI0033CB3FDB
MTVTKLNAAAHRRWLGKTMALSCGLWEGTNDLDTAQLAKYRLLSDWAEVTAQSRVLDVGSGNGGLLSYLSRERGVAAAFATWAAQLRGCCDRLGSVERDGTTLADWLEFTTTGTALFQQGALSVAHLGLRRIDNHSARRPHRSLPGFTVACVYRDEHPGNAPVVAGLGSDQRLGHAMYKALLEAVAVFRYANWMAAKAAIEDCDVTDKDRFFDLDDNVAYYTEPANAALIDKRFAVHVEVSARDLPPDAAPDLRTRVKALVAAFARTGKQLGYLDITTPDIRHLGLTVCRVWSPDTLSLCPPSAPPLLHKRFADYGGATNPEPHPYP